MSTKERFKNLIWQTLSDIYNDPATTDDAWVTVGEISSETGVSKVTVRKYLEELKMEGTADRVKVGSAIGYRPVWGG